MFKIKAAAVPSKNACLDYLTTVSRYNNCRDIELLLHEALTFEDRLWEPLLLYIVLYDKKWILHKDFLKLVRKSDWNNVKKAWRNFKWQERQPLYEEMLIAALKIGLIKKINSMKNYKTLRIVIDVLREAGIYEQILISKIEPTEKKKRRRMIYDKRGCYQTFR